MCCTHNLSASPNDRNLRKNPDFPVMVNEFSSSSWVSSSSAMQFAALSRKEKSLMRLPLTWRMFFTRPNGREWSEIFLPTAFGTSERMKVLVVLGLKSPPLAIGGLGGFQGSWVSVALNILDENVTLFFWAPLLVSGGDFSTCIVKGVSKGGSCVFLT